jgi:putative oxidoreductase
VPCRWREDHCTEAPWCRAWSALLFLIFGWGKLTDHSLLEHDGYRPLREHDPYPIAGSAVISAASQARKRVIRVSSLLAVVVALYTFACAFIGHPYWNMTGTDRFVNMIPIPSLDRR